MAVPPVLVVVTQFDPPTFHFVGPIHESTINKMNDILPYLTRNVGSARRDPPRFTQNPSLALNNWSVTLKNHLTDEASRMAIFCAILKCLEEEGGWKLHDTHASNDENFETNTLFFVNKTLR